MVSRKMQPHYTKDALEHMEINPKMLEERDSLVIPDINTDISDLNSTSGGLCRICLKECSLLNLFLGTDTAQMLQFCGFWEPEEYDTFLNQICHDCSLKIRNAFDLKNLCITSKKFLESLLCDSINLENVSQENHENLLIEKQSINTNEEAEENSLVFLNNKESNETEKVQEQAEENVLVFFEFRCRYCNECFESGQELLNHDTVCAQKSIKEVEQQLEIEKACESIITNEKVTEELPKQNLEQQFSCGYCKEVYSDENDLKIHQSIHSEGLQCIECGKEFSALKCLKRHLKTHMKVRDYCCKVCNKSFTESSALLKHTNKWHLNLPIEKNYKCKICSQSFSDKYYLDIHTKKHTGQRDIECGECGKTFYDPRSLWTHMRSHKGEKYQCKICLQSFSQAHSLHTHTRSKHTGERSHCCQECGKRFTLKSLLNKHKKVHDRQKLEMEQRRKALEKAAEELIC